MADDPTPKPVAEGDPKPAVAAIENKIEAVADKIAETPDEDKDKEWRENLNSLLMTIKTDLAKLTAERGTSPEVKELAAQMTELLAEVRSMKSGEADPSPKPAPGSEGDPASLETLPETLSETEPPAPAPKPKAKTPPKSPASSVERRAKNWL